MSAPWSGDLLAVQGLQAVQKPRYVGVDAGAYEIDGLGRTLGQLPALLPFELAL